MDNLRKVKFRRSITSKEGQFKEPTLIVFRDRSYEACCLLIYLRWEREDSHMECRLVMGKM
jgi:hypothetical protein